MTMDSKVCSIRSHLCRSNDKEEEDLVGISIKQIDWLKHVEMSKVYHCNGLLLCVTKDHSRLVVWNPYLLQQWWISPRTDFHRLDSYALGYDMNRNHKILRFLDCFEKGVCMYEIYDFSSWRVLEVTPDWEIDPFQGGVSVKGNTYFYAHESTLAPGFSGGYMENGDFVVDDYEVEDFLLCFDFTREIFGPRLPLPFHSWSLEDTVTLSCVREEQLAVLYQEDEDSGIPCNIVHIWVTTSIEPNSVSWSKFLTVEMRPFARTGVRFDHYTGGTFFIDEEQKVAVVFDIDGYLPRGPKTVRYHTAFIIGEDGYFKSVSLGVAPKNPYEPPCSGYVPELYLPPLVCSSSYLPSLVHLNQQHKRKERDA
ncbi:PREDICTED: F-box/kelch-repeat protein At1g24800-like [Camelina sativa]|uniref:F-box/kelch-repeat protein At1g24800-like n=1 Tax=Camelina sativa TaxID=90675 RepID=A0ABM0VY63_CAMSA|nr:PREDICTED: F-box/kelch-repeat protein At1g24800-like [Camelina sativa]